METLSPLPCSLLPPARKATKLFPFLLYINFCQLAKFTSNRVCKDTPARCERNIFLSNRSAAAELGRKRNWINKQNLMTVLSKKVVKLQWVYWEEHLKHLSSQVLYKDVLCYYFFIKCNTGDHIPCSMSHINPTEEQGVGLMSRGTQLGTK